MRFWVKWAGLLAAAVVITAALARGDQPQLRDIRLQELPAEAHQTLQLIRRGGPVSP